MRMATSIAAWRRPSRLLRPTGCLFCPVNWFSPAVSRQLIRRAVGQPHSSPELLTPREMEVLRLLAQGLDNTAIAQQLVITRRTVQNHVSSIYGKLGVESRIEAALYAIRHGLARVL